MVSSCAIIGVTSMSLFLIIPSMFKKVLFDLVLFFGTCSLVAENILYRA